MKERSPADTSLFILVIAESRNFFDWFLPPPYEVSNPEGKPMSTVEVRRGEVQATAATMAVGTITALLFQDSMPFIAMGIAAVFLVYQYEHALKIREKA